MGSVASSNTLASNNNGLSDLLQTLTNENSPLLSTLSSPKIQSALENAPASDIVEISDQAQQLQSHRRAVRDFQHLQLAHRFALFGIGVGWLKRNLTGRWIHAQPWIFPGRVNWRLTKATCRLRKRKPSSVSRRQLLCLVPCTTFSPDNARSHKRAQLCWN